MAAFIRLKPAITVIMAPVMTRGRSRSGCSMSPSTKPTCYASRCQNGSIMPSSSAVARRGRLKVSSAPGESLLGEGGVISYRLPASVAEHSAKRSRDKVPEELPRRFLPVPLSPPEPPGP